MKVLLAHVTHFARYTNKLTRGNKVPRGTIAEFVENTVSVRLLHLSMDVVTRISELSNLFRQKFNAVHRVTKDNTLVDLQF